MVPLPPVHEGWRSDASRFWCATNMSPERRRREPNTVSRVNRKGMSGSRPVHSSRKRVQCPINETISLMRLTRRSSPAWEE